MVSNISAIILYYICFKKQTKSMHFKTLQDLKTPILLGQLIKMQKEKKKPFVEM